jgi:uncharacterized membrane protein YjgN (DUF898 family)
MAMPVEHIVPQASRKLSFHGSGGEIFGMHAKNMLLAILTCGIYAFWGKVALRRYMYGQLEFEGQRFAYHGNGKDLFLGFLKLAVILVPAIALFVYVSGDDPKHDLAGTLVIYGTLALIYPLARVGSRRYLLRHLSWSGIRFSFRGTVRGFLAIYVPGLILSVLTLGVYYPWMQAKLHNYMVDHTYFGNLAGKGTATGGELFRHLFRAVIFYPFTLGIVVFYYLAAKQRVYVRTSQLGPLGFGSNLTGSDAFGYRLYAGLVTLLTLGFGSPWVQAAKLRLLCNTVEITGDLDLAAIKQELAASGGSDPEFQSDVMGLDLDLAI